MCLSSVCFLPLTLFLIKEPSCSQAGVSSPSYVSSHVHVPSSRAAATLHSCCITPFVSQPPCPTLPPLSLQQRPGGLHYVRKTLLQSRGGETLLQNRGRQPCMVTLAAPCLPACLHTTHPTPVCVNTTHILARLRPGAEV